MNKQKLLLKIIAILSPSLMILSANAVTCDPSNSTTIDRVTACISQSHMTRLMQDFQNISDSNPDPTFINFAKKPKMIPPGSRDAGTKGDIASVKYIANYMKNLGYQVTTQSYPVPYSVDKVIPIMAEVSPIAHSYVPGTDFSSSIFSGSGDVTAQLQPVGTFTFGTPPVTPSNSGCSASDFANFVPGRIALMERGFCANRVKVLNAIAAGAKGAITFDYSSNSNGGNTLISTDGMTIPVFAYIPYYIGIDLYNQTLAGPVVMHMKANVLNETRTTYNVIADSKYGDPNSILLLGAHYDSIFGAGILDNASGTVSMMEIAAAMKDTKTVNKLRFGFWGGEELGLYGSDFYASNLSSADLNKIDFNLDFDVTATKNFVYYIADPAYAIANPSGAVTDAADWPNNGIKGSALGVDLFKGYMNSVHLPYSLRLADVLISGSDDDTFILAGISVSSLVTAQGGGKTAEEAMIFGGTAGNFDACADTPYVFCDNIDNTDPVVQTTVTKAFAGVTVGLAFTPNLNNNGGKAVYKKGTAVSNWVGRHFKP